MYIDAIASYQTFNNKKTLGNGLETSYASLSWMLMWVFIKPWMGKNVSKIYNDSCKVDF